MNRARIAVIGATGFTGRLVAHELARGDAPFLLTGRSAERLERLAREIGGAETATVDVTSVESLQRTLRAGDVVINCAGPFSDLGEPVVAACVRAGTHYLDTTGEQRFMKRVLDRYHAAAQQAGMVVVNAMAFEYALGDCAAALAVQGLATPIRSIDVTYALQGSAAASSRGTRLSVLRVLRDGGYRYRGGRWDAARTGSERRTVELPGGRRRSAVWFPAGEILTVPRHVEVGEVRGWMVMNDLSAAAIPLVSPILPVLAGLAGPAAQWLLRHAPEGPTPEQRRESRFLIRADAEDVEGSKRSVAVEGRDPYGITGAIAVHAARQVMERHGELSGVLAPAQVLHPQTLHNVLEPWGAAWHEDREISA